MLVLISPSKTLDFESKIPEQVTQVTIPSFLQEAQKLVIILKTYTEEALGKLLAISPKLAKINYQRFQHFSDLKHPNHSRPAIFSYKGDVYEPIEVNEYSMDELNFANNSLRIISGLYGILKPLDLIQAYRLEMSTRLASEAGKNLYLFWGNLLSNKLNQDAIENKAKYIINLASQEYIDAIELSSLKTPMINIVFKEKRDNEYKIIGIYAKKARGVMANFIIRNHCTQPEDLKSFRENGYKFIDNFSQAGEYVFVR